MPPSGLAALRYAFLVSMVAGALGITIGWRMQSTWVTVGLPLLAMAGYMVAATLMDRTNAATAAFADSVYFMGFLFTLIALTVSLFDLQPDAEGVYDLGGVIERFGVALVTTIVGLGVRIYLTNFVAATEDTLAQAEEALAESAANFRLRLDMLTIELTAQHHAMQGSLETARSELVEVSSAARKAMQDTAASLAEESGRLSQAASEPLRKVAETVSSRLQTAGDLLQGATEELAQRIRAANLPTDALVASLSEPVGALAATLREFDSWLRQWSRAQEGTGEAAGGLTASLTRAAGQAEALTESLASSRLPVDGFRAIGEEADALKDALEALRDSVLQQQSGLSAQADGVSRLRNEIERDAAEVADFRDRIAKDVEEARHAVAEVYKEMTQAARYVTEQLGP